MTFTGLAMTAVLATMSADEVDFNREIRPILANHCLPCHGPDSAKRQAKLRLDLRDGAIKGGLSGPAILPGKPGESELVERIRSSDLDEVMPPPSFQKPLSPAQKDLLARWIAGGAEYAPHWAFLAPKRPTTPPVKDAEWCRNPIDRFILARLESEGGTHSPEASKATLVRRLSLDLRGLPPSRAEASDFVADQSPEAYNRLVERFLSSPHYGERMAVDWLDAARFADTNGYQVDRDREAYPWRDWVIRAFNENKPFDEFTIEQIAGDLLPNPTLDQRIATGFHRNHMMNEEGGIIPEEFLAEYTADRVETTAAVWLGQTFQCARCHDHKYDPFSQRDFYALKAFYHNVSEKGVGNYGANIRRNSPPMIRLPAPEIETRLAAIDKDIRRAERSLALLHIRLTSEQRIWEVQVIANAPAVIATLSKGFDKGLMSKPAGKRTPAEAEAVAKAFRETVAEYNTADAKLTDLRKQRDKVDLEIPTALVMEELPTPRATFVLMRGAYDRPGARVTPDTPASLPGFPPNAPRNRLGLARWLVDGRNPLTARVVVNRIWQSFFGTGLVKTSEDFGTQGELPSHPELLDWLATEFVASGWDVKHIVRLIVTSSTYRQTSSASPESFARDPENRLLGRGARFRLQAEFLRDQALALSGRLVERVGGPSVKPYHPPGLYEQVVAGSSANTYVQDHGDALYRRSLYTYWKRSVPNPAMLVFDAPFRESCTLRRTRTNTPLQALNLENDPTYIEAARGIAERVYRAQDRLATMFRRVLIREPKPVEARILDRAYASALKGFRADVAAAKALIGIGESKADPACDPVELAALTTVASMLLNLDETVHKE